MSTSLRAWAELGLRVYFVDSFGSDSGLDYSCNKITVFFCHINSLFIVVKEIHKPESN